MRAIAPILLAVLVAAGCSKDTPANEPADVAERFLDLYLLEIDQERALPLTTGVAQQRLKDELANVAGVRATGYSASAAKPRIFYERAMLREDADAGRARAIYDITIKEGRGETRRHVMLSLTNRDEGRWKAESCDFERSYAIRWRRHWPAPDAPDVV